MNATEENDIPTIDTLNENALVKGFKEMALKDINKTAVSNMNNERSFINKKIGRDEKTIDDVEAYYKEAALEAKDVFNNYYIEKYEIRGKTKLTNIVSLKDTLNKIDTDLKKIPYEKNLDEEVYKMILKITSSEKIAKIMLKELETGAYDAFKKNAIDNVSKSKGTKPTEYIETLASIRYLAITKYNELNLAYTEISDSKETRDHLNKERIKDGLEPTF